MLNIDQNEIMQSLAQIKQRIANAAIANNRVPNDINLVAVSKTQTNDKIDQIIGAGQKIFGENKIQEGVYHFANRDCHDLELRFIGPLQSNKAKAAVELFDIIETLDRENLAKEIAKAIQKTARSPKFLIEVNIGEEAQKAGILPQNLNAFLNILEKNYGISPIGLMCIPPFSENPEPYFQQTQSLMKDFGFAQLSMGMSSDFEAAIKYGATHVRIGTALFGNRN